MSEAATFHLEMTRQIRAPRERVFDAFTDQTALATWHCPRGMSVLEARADARVGGKYRLVIGARDGETHRVHGEYQTLDRANFLAYTWEWEGGTELPAGMRTLIEVTLTAKDGGTHMHMRHSGFPDAATRDAHVSGWQSVFNNLVDYLDPEGSAGTLTVYGDARSTYVRTVRLALEEKGLRYTLDPVTPRDEALLAHNPFGRIPAFADGPIEFYETRAILSYINEVFAGTNLMPQTGPTARARCEQWISLINCHAYDAMVRRYVLQYVFPKGENGQPDRAIIDAAVPEMAKQLDALEQAYGGRDFLVGNALSMADLFFAPIVEYLGMFPESQALLETRPNIRRGHAVMRARPSYAATQPKFD
ncbi:SRPBCC domain-containing protein [Cupriavidus pauculus]|uniref:glutathione transferase n=1 Tax=Cupriavidus pauculus TaxID=82633 RepID=A0A2N5C2G1_9BURK|nr:SRPBCC domain-containing protein [Cupriavidus pauculus]PLP96401.1 glutathione S-transferase [Cupriavidus pauculus]